MGLGNDVKAILEGTELVAYRPPALYIVGAHTIFVIRGGAVHLKYLIGRAVSGAPAAGSTVTTTVAGVAGDAGAVNVNGALNSLIMIPLNVASAVTPNALAHPVLTAAAASDGMVASVGNIVLTVAAANFVVTIEWSLVYTKLTPMSIISLA